MEPHKNASAGTPKFLRTASFRSLEKRRRANRAAQTASVSCRANVAAKFVSGHCSRISAGICDIDHVRFPLGLLSGPCDVSRSPRAILIGAPNVLAAPALWIAHVPRASRRCLPRLKRDSRRFASLLPNRSRPLDQVVVAPQFLDAPGGSAETDSRSSDLRPVEARSTAHVERGVRRS